MSSSDRFRMGERFQAFERSLKRRLALLGTDQAGTAREKANKKPTVYSDQFRSAGYSSIGFTKRAGCFGSFEVTDLSSELAGREILIPPNSPSYGVCVAFIVEKGAPIELLEFTAPAIRSDA
jgi:hypothetical protein